MRRILMSLKPVVKDKTCTPFIVKQVSGAKYAEFENINSLTTMHVKQYAYTRRTVNGKKKTRNTPSTIRCTNYRVNIPDNSLVDKITVHYNIWVSGAKDDGSPVDKDYPNIPASTIRLLHLNKSKKGQSPSKKGQKARSVTFKGKDLKNIRGRNINLTDFGVEIGFKANTNNNDGYVYVGYCYITVKYRVPDFSCVMRSANSTTVSNHGVYRLGVSLSDKSLSGDVTSIMIRVPSGFTYKSLEGDHGTVRRNGDYIQYTPNRGSPNKLYSVAAVLLFDVDVEFSSGSSAYEATFEANVVGKTEIVKHVASIVQYSDDARETDVINNKDSVIENIDGIHFIPLNNTVDLYFKLDSDELSRLNKVDGLPDGALYRVMLGCRENPDFKYVAGADNLEGLANTYYVFLNPEGEVLFYASDIKGVNRVDLTVLGENEYSYYICDRLVPADDGVFHYNIMFREFEVQFYDSDHNISDAIFLKITGEDLNRLGDGESYTVQADMKLTTQEKFIRDWGLNHRIGVFNNRVESNIKEYYEIKSMNTNCNLQFIVPGKYDLNDIKFTIISTEGFTYYTGKSEAIIVLPDTESQVNITDYNNVYSSSFDNGDAIITCFIKSRDDKVLEKYDIHVYRNTDENVEQHLITEDSTDYNNLSDHDILDNVLYISELQAGLNEFNNVYCSFVYDADYPLYIVIFDDYDDIPDKPVLEFNEPCIIEDYEHRLLNGLYPFPLMNLLGNDDVSVLNLDKGMKSDECIVYDLPLSEDYSSDETQAIMGLELIGNIEFSDDIIITAYLQHDNIRSHSRSMVLENNSLELDSDNGFVLGGDSDLWGLSIQDMVNLEDWSVAFYISNTLKDNDATVNLNDIYVNLYVNKITESDELIAYVNDEDTRYYGLYLTNVEVPEGLVADSNFIDVKGTDLNEVYNQSIREKSIKLTFSVDSSCDLISNTYMLREITRLFLPDRDEYNRPIMKTLRLSHYPDIEWEYIMDSPIVPKINAGAYDECVVECIVPHGTGYDREETVTGSTGRVNGITRIKPVITVIPYDSNILIREIESNQQFNIGYAGDWLGKLVEIDCNNRRVTLFESVDDYESINDNDDVDVDVDGVDLTGYADYNVDWFNIRDDYDFEGVNCFIRTVSYKERW